MDEWVPRRIPLVSDTSYDVTNLRGRRYLKDCISLLVMTAAVVQRRMGYSKVMHDD
jgi:hypothetical protein